MEIRPAKPEEYAAVGDLTATGYAADDLLQRADGSPDHYEAVLRDASARAPLAELVVAVDDQDRLLGTVTWCPPGSPLCELATGPEQGEFRMLSVDPAHRRQGVARALTLWCLQRAREQGLREVWLCSLPVMVKAHELYRSLGFVRTPERDWRPVPTVVLWAFRLTLSGSRVG